MSYSHVPIYVSGRMYLSTQELRCPTWSWPRYVGMRRLVELITMSNCFEDIADNTLD